MFYCPECIAFSLIKRDFPALKKVLNVKFKKYHDIVLLPNINTFNFTCLGPGIDYDDEDLFEQLYIDADGLDQSEQNTDSISEILSDNGDEHFDMESESLSENGNSDEDVDTGELNEDQHDIDNQMESVPLEENIHSESNAFGLNNIVHVNEQEFDEPPRKTIRLSDQVNVAQSSSSLEARQSPIGASTCCVHQPFLLMNPEPNENCFAGISLRFIALWIASNFFEFEVLDILSAAGADWSQPMRFHYSVGNSAEAHGPLEMSRLAVREVHPIYWVLKHQMPSLVRDSILSNILKTSPHAIVGEISEIVRIPVIKFDGMLRESITTTVYTSPIAMFVTEFWFRYDSKDDFLDTLLNYGCDLTEQKKIVQTAEENKASYTVTRVRVLTSINNLLVHLPGIFLLEFKKLISAGLMDFHGTGTGEDPVRVAPRMHDRWSSPTRQYSILDEWLTFCDSAAPSSAVLRASRVLFSLGYGRPELRGSCTTDADPRLRAERLIIRELRAEGVLNNDIKSKVLIGNGKTIVLCY